MTQKTLRHTPDLTRLSVAENKAFLRVPNKNNVPA
jgi:hypothetical protein